MCWIPRDIGELGPSPALVVEQWLQQWDTIFSGANPHTSALFTVTGTNIALPQAVSADSWRKALASSFRDRHVGTHSLQRGGAAWYIHVAHVDESVVQAQGGWSSADVMRTFYSQCSLALIKQRLLGTVGRLRHSSRSPRRERSRSPSVSSWDAAPWCVPAPRTRG